MFPFSAVPGNSFFGDEIPTPYSDDEDYYRGLSPFKAAKQEARPQTAEQGTYTRHHPSGQGPAHHSSHRSAPVSPQAWAAHQPRHTRQQQQDNALLRHQQQQQQRTADSGASSMPVHAGRKTYGAAPQPASYGPQAYPPPPAAPAGPRKQLSPEAAATRIQTEWRKARLARHKPALKQLAAAAGRLRQLTAKLQELQRQQPGVPLTQKQYLELSETVMKVLFDLDATSCGAAELRAKRKELTTCANRLLDDIQVSHKAAPAAAGGAASSTSAAAAAGAQAQQQQQPAKQKRGSWFRRS